ncbi:hypothetical protein HG535_0G00200 [Zygotorulaspora mrakii]|uniref:Uncharacterized protein n=1 Tax=Zygotorulaspora mrakii TaxID=42260 RepID=A0A7H9B5Z0_ZYGMR|nr:uncharacterized protein HG535_0G00200 [Zygotorulaspora mrakii]QLG74135.1 hypothetical protein HG535_0G00200 [Zygotorulaspora mrakii]
MYCDYNTNFGSRLSAQAVDNSSIKRSINHFEKDALSVPCAKRTKNDNFAHSKRQPLQGGCFQLNNSKVELPFITPAPTPADVDMTEKSTREENLPSPYSETEEYMIRGYYEEEKDVDNSWACIESVQYSLYDLTPEEYELTNENTAEHDYAGNTFTNSWGDKIPKGQVELQCNFNDTCCNDSYDINMR